MLQVRPSEAAATLSSRASAAYWFLLSGIQSPGGGVARYYRDDIGVRLADSTEITGYALGGLLHLDEIEAATRAGEWLISTGWSESLQLFPFEVDHGPQAAYFFDSGIIARALVSLWRYSGDDRYLEFSIRAAESMIKDFMAPCGYHPIIELPSKEPHEYTTWWSRRPGCFQLKAALAWKELAGITGDPKFEEHYNRQLDLSIKTVSELIAIETEPVKITDRLHAYCYFLEGLLPVAHQYQQVLRQGIAEVASYLRELEPQFARSDVYAQLLRVRLLADRQQQVVLDQKAAEYEVEALRKFQIEDEDPWLDGSFVFGRRDGQLILHANPVSTTFAAQALHWWEQHQKSRFTQCWTALI